MMQVGQDYLYHIRSLGGSSNPDECDIFTLPFGKLVPHHRALTTVQNLGGPQRRVKPAQVGATTFILKINKNSKGNLEKDRIE